MSPLRYTLGALLALPLLPLMYVQARRIRARVPVLPEASGPAGQVRPPGVSGPPLRLLTLGESTIAGVGVATHAEGFSGTLAEELATRLGVAVDWTVYARSGYTAQRVSERLLPRISETEVDLIVIGLGGNDAFTLNRPRRWRRALQTLIEQLRDRHPAVPIVFCQMPPIKEFPAFTPLIRFVVGNLVEILGAELVALVQSYPGVYALGDVITLAGWLEKFHLTGSPASFFSDGVHPAPLTYQVWARDVAEQIVQGGLLPQGKPG